jgi:quinol monooxygenase YgiN
MIIRKITYMAKPGKDILEWIKNNSQAMRAVKGMRKVEFIRSKNEPDEWGALMYFHKQKYLDKYKESGPYKDLVKSLSEYADMTKPIKDEVFEYLEV